MKLEFGPLGRPDSRSHVLRLAPRLEHVLDGELIAQALFHRCDLEKPHLSQSGVGQRASADTTSLTAEVLTVPRS